MDVDSPTGTLVKKKARGQTKCKMIHTRNFEERYEVTFDKGQVVGPTGKRVSELSNFIGTIARNPRFITLLFSSWHVVTDDIKQTNMEICQHQVHHSSRRKEVGAGWYSRYLEATQEKY
ncbi:uncharacterized protein LOC142164643 [Nicotiana tabacum]|uniref:Uncharacterized protein LOC142164643 n=2 Tax=Nicotiana tabacum TaxID=4097 RepID=A0AC58S246_TOBAC